MGPAPNFEPGKLTAGNAALLAALAVPLLVAILLGSNKKKQRGVPAKVGELLDGVTMRNHGFLAPVETPWEEATTLAALFEQACSQFAEIRALGTRTLIKEEADMSKDGKQLEKLTLGDYVWLTYEEAFHRVCNFSSGLVAVGHQKEEKVALFAETRAEWMIGLQGCFRQSFTVVTIYASLGESALAHSLNETEVATVVCDNKQLQKLLKLGSQLKTVKSVICMDEQNISGAPNGWNIVPFSTVERLGKDLSINPHLPEPEDIAVIMYTSGSTGMPKGVIMSHSNLVATVAGVITCVPDISSTDVYLAYLPLAHVLELVAECTMIASGAAIGYGSPLTLTDSSSKIKKGTQGDVTALRPTLMAAVPAVLDRVRDAVRGIVDAKGGATKKLFHLAYRRRLAAIEGSWLGAWGPERLLWDALVFSKTHEALGGRVRGVLSGAAPLSPGTQRFFNICFGVPIGQGYGLTETCAGGTFSEWDDESVGRVGPPLPSCYVKLVDWEAGGYRTTDKPFPRGEIVIGGPNVTMGYFKNQAKTNEDFKVDELGIRWFYTGDIGQFHEDGCLQIIDRKKDIVKLQHGEYISLGKVEAALSVSPFVESILIHADPFHSYPVALVVPSRVALENWAQEVKIPHSNFPELCEKKEAEQEVLKSIEEAARQAKLSRVEVPSRVKLLPEPWTPESGLVTAALKLKRESLQKLFAEELKQLYA